MLKHEPASTLGELVGPPLEITDPQFFLQNYLTSNIDGEGHVLGRNLMQPVKNGILELGRIYEQSGTTEPLQDIIDTLRAFGGKDKVDQKTIDVFQDYVDHLKMVAPDDMRSKTVDKDEFAKAS